MRVIGLTGNIGCGKSTVASMLARRGVATIDADEVTREIRAGDAEVREQIEATFGTLAAAEIAQRVFRDPAALATLEAIVHPHVRANVAAQLDHLERSGVEIAAIEAIKLLESPLRDRCDEVWAVTCDERDAISRVARDRGLTADEVMARLAAQSTQADKVAAADVVIDGSAVLEETERQVVAALTALRSRPV
ncbi:MAG: dephospho-CoA kinase [Chloroflexota bacterium]|nr:dephospho-CoA kinase [Chloroflexota bacterium]